ncbi:MAG: hypothetical protein ACOYK1_06320 [Vampirovibrionia bacterium]
MSTPFINPYETKDVVATSLNNLDKQSQDIISYLDGLFSSETVKDKQIILDDGTVETLKPFEVANSQGAFWDKGTTYYFQPVADRLREISLEIQGKLNPTDVSATLKAGITGLFSKTLDDSRETVLGTNNPNADDFANDWTYEKWYNDPDVLNINDLDTFLKKVGTAAFKMVDAVGDTGQLITNTSGLKINISNLEDVAKLLDDGDNFYNDDNTIDNPNTTTVIEGADSNKQPEFYLIGNRKLPVFGAVENAPDPNAQKANLTSKYPGGTTNAAYKQDLYNYQNKRIDPNNIYWNDPTFPKEPEEVFYDMVAIAITQQKVGEYKSSAPNDIRTMNTATAESARNSLKNIAGNYFKDNEAWYNSFPRNLDPKALPPTPKPPAFLLSKSASGKIDYTLDGSYGAFKATDTGNLASLISDATDIGTTDVTATLKNWNLGPPPGISAMTHSSNIDRITKYYTQSYISSSITSTFGKKDAAISTKSFLIHEALNNLNPSQNPYLEEVGGEDDKDVVKFNDLLADASGYLRSPGNTANTHVSNQMTQLMDLFLENFDIKTNRYVEDKRTLVDLFSGKLLKTAGENAEVQKTLFQNINSATKDISSQIKNTLTRGVPNSAESQFTLDLFNQTAVRKEDYGLSPNPADPTQHFLPSSWANNKDKYLPAMYYYNPLNPNPSGDAANNTLNGTDAKNGLPAGFPIMDVRDFDQFFKATKLALTNHIMNYLNTGGASFITANNLAGLYNEMGAFLTDATTTTYPGWADAGFATDNSQAAMLASTTAIFGTLDLSPTGDKTSFSRAIQLYKSLDKIIDNMQDRVSSVGQSVPKIPRPINSSVINPSTGLAVTLTLQSSITGYGDKPSPKLVKSFLDMHEDTKAVSADANADSLNRISYLINTFDDYSKFSQNSAFEGIYAGEVFEADKQNFANVNTKKPEPGPDGSMPEDKSIPKPEMAALSSSVVITKLGQILTNKVNDLVAENDVIGIDAVTRKDGPNANIGKIDTTTLSGSKESQTYLNNILKQISSLSGTNLNVDVSPVVALISNKIEEAMQTLIKETDVGGSNATRMVFIDDKTIDELISLRNTLERVGTGSGTPMDKLKQLLNNADLDGLKVLAYPNVDSTHNAPGYYKFNSLTDVQKKLINDIRDGNFKIDSTSVPPTYTLDGVTTSLPETNLPDGILNTLGTLAANINTMLDASQKEKPPRIIDPEDLRNKLLIDVNSALSNAKLDFTALTATTSGNNVSYNAIVNADVYNPPTSPVTMASLLRSDAAGGNAADRTRAQDIIRARKDLLEKLLYENTIGGVAINKLNKGNASNPYKDLLNPTTYSALDPANLSPSLPSNLTDITTTTVFQKHIGNIDTFIKGVNNSLINATLENPPRNIDPTTNLNKPENDPIIALSRLAQLDFTGLKNPTKSVWANITDPLSTSQLATIKQRLIDSDVGGAPITNNANKINILAARKNLLEFFLEGKKLDPKVLNPAAAVNNNNSYLITEIKTHTRYKHLISPVTYDYPDDDLITGTGTTSLVNAKRSDPLTLNSTVDNSKADSFTLKEIMKGDADYTNSLNDLETVMGNSAGFTTANKQLYIRKMQHFNILFNTLSGGTTNNPPLAAFGTPPALFPPLPLAPTQNLREYIESLASGTSITASTEFQTILTKVTNLIPITENINALEVSLAGEIKKPKAGPESEIYSTLHLFNQIEDQTPSAGYEAGILQLLNKRQIKDGSNIIDLKHREAAAISPKDGLYQYSGYEANKDYLKPTNSPSISGRNKAPDTSTYPNEGWDLNQLLTTRYIAITDLPPFLTLTKARDFLAGLNEVYKDMQASKSPVIKEQLKVFDLWLRNNSFSPISDAALRGKDSLEADINILDHITKGATDATGNITTTTINTFLTASKAAAVNNKKLLEDLDDIRTAGKGFAQRIDDGLSATKLRNYFQENIFYPSDAPFPKALPGDTRADLTKDYFGWPLNNSNLPVFGVNIFGRDPISGTTYTVPSNIQAYYANANSGVAYTTAAAAAPPMPARIVSNSYKNFGKSVPLDNPYQKIMENINTLLTALTAAETAGHYNKVNLYKTMIKNLLGESSEAPKAALVTLASAENTPLTPLILPGDPSLVDTTIGGLTYGTNNYPSTNMKTKILDARKTINETINPAKYKGTINSAALANFALSSKADQPTTMRTVGVESKSIQELAILLYIMQMFEQSNWDFEKYINDTSRYEIEAAVE